MELRRVLFHSFQDSERADAVNLLLYAVIYNNFPNASIDNNQKVNLPIP
jgi:hypothetical protein